MIHLDGLPYNIGLLSLLGQVLSFGILSIILAIAAAYHAASKTGNYVRSRNYVSFRNSGIIIFSMMLFLLFAYAVLNIHSGPFSVALSSDILLFEIVTDFYSILIISLFMKTRIYRVLNVVAFIFIGISFFIVSIVSGNRNPVYPAIAFALWFFPVWLSTASFHFARRLSIMDYSVNIVHGESMEPVLTDGEVIISTRDFESIGPCEGDIVQMLPPLSIQGIRTKIAHRIVSVDGAHAATKGDNNSRPDIPLLPLGNVSDLVLGKFENNGKFVSLTRTERKVNGLPSSGDFLNKVRKARELLQKEVAVSKLRFAWRLALPVIFSQAIFWFVHYVSMTFG